MHHMHHLNDSLLISHYYISIDHHQEKTNSTWSRWWPGHIYYSFCDHMQNINWSVSWPYGHSHDLTVRWKKCKYWWCDHVGFCWPPAAKWAVTIDEYWGWWPWGNLLWPWGHDRDHRVTRNMNRILYYKTLYINNTIIYYTILHLGIPRDIGPNALNTDPSRQLVLY